MEQAYLTLTGCNIVQRWSEQSVLATAFEAVIKTQSSVYYTKDLAWKNSSEKNTIIFSNRVRSARKKKRCDMRVSVQTFWIYNTALSGGCRVVSPLRNGSHAPRRTFKITSRPGDLRGRFQTHGFRDRRVEGLRRAIDPLLAACYPTCPCRIP